MRYYLLSFLVGLISIADARVVNVKDHGIVPGKDVTLAVNQLIRSLQNEAEVSLVFPEGQYDFYPDNAIEVYRAVANHDNGLKRIAFPLFNHRNLTIEGNGSEFLFHGRIIPFTLESVDSVTLKDFSIDFVRPFHAELVVVERDVNGNTVVVETDSTQYPHTFRNGMVYFDRFGQEDPLTGSNIVFDPHTRSPIYDTNRFNLINETVEVMPAGSDRMILKNAFRELPPIGSVLVVYGNHPTSRLCHAIQICNSKDINIEEVTVYAAGGMGLIVERTENISLDGMKVTSSGERLIATRADATHFIGCKGTITVENCVLEHMLDDSLNVHGAYVPVVKQLDGNTFLCEISHFQQWGLTFAEPGDEIAILSRNTILPFHETTVVDVQKLNERRFILTVTDLPDPLPEVPLSFENLSWNPDLVMRNNIIRENRARSVLVTTKGKVLIENNYFSSQMHGILIEGDNNFWYESGAVKDVVIRGNTFENTSFGLLKGYPLLAAPKLTPAQHYSEERYHKNIHFVDNTIRSFNGNIAKACTVENLVISGNKIEFSTDYPEVETSASIHLEHCKDVKITNNHAVGFDAPLTLKALKSTKGVEVSGNLGIADG